LNLCLIDTIKIPPKCLKKKIPKTGNQQETDKTKQLENWKENPVDKELTTNHGVKVSHTDDSLKAGSRGPTIMEDFHFREKLDAF
jgi:catalase